MLPTSTAGAGGGVRRRACLDGGLFRDAISTLARSILRGLDLVPALTTQERYKPTTPYASARPWTLWPTVPSSSGAEDGALQESSPVSAGSVFASLTVHWSREAIRPYNGYTRLGLAEARRSADAAWVNAEALISTDRSGTGIACRRGATTTFVWTGSCDQVAERLGSPNGY
jgi:hypothetical protein